MSKRDEIAQRVLGKLTNRETSAEAPTPRPRPMNTFIGQLGQQVAQGYAARVEELERERESGLVLLRLDPKTIALTEFANRHKLGLDPSDESFKTFRESIRTHGQDTPVRVRPASAGAAKPFELVEGHRRHAACLSLDKEISGGFPILARLDAAAKDPKNLVLKMYRENAERKDLSPYEYGRMFQSWLAAKVFQKQGELAKAVGLVDSSVSNYLQVAELPAEVLTAFGDPRAIPVRWITEIARALKANGAAVRATAREIVARDPRPSADAVFRELAAFGVEEGKRAGSSREETVKIKGKVAFSLTRRAGKVTVKFGKTIDRAFQQEVGDAIKEAAERLLSKRLGGK
jgi:ParB family chromosome partitioning protein